MKFFYTIGIILIPFLILSQCPDSTIIFKNQLQVDSFKINFPNCTSCPEDIFVSSEWNRISNLNGLNNLERIEGDLFIVSNNDLESLNGLSNLKEIDGTFKIVDNKKINSLIGLSNLTSIGNLTIEKPHADTLAGLENVKSIGSIELISKNNSFVLKGLEKLENCDRLILLGLVAFPNLGNVSKLKLVYINENNLLSNFNCFENFSLDTIETLGINEISSISTIGIENLEQINWLFFQDIDSLDLEDINLINTINILGISNCTRINNINNLNGIKCSTLGLSSNATLETLGEELNLPNLKFLSLRDNKLLSNISGLEAPQNSFDHLEITGNTNLNFCGTETICNVIINHYDNVDIENNGTECSDKELILTSCLTSNNETSKSEINIWPNPASENIFISNSNNLEYTIFNQFSVLVQHGLISDGFIKVNTLLPGMYFLNLRTNKSNQVIKIVIN